MYSMAFIFIYACTLLTLNGPQASDGSADTDIGVGEVE